MREQILAELKEIVLTSLEGIDATVYLFGSWARKEEKQSSDIDIAIDTQEPVSIGNGVKLNDQIEESTIPYHVDIVSLQDVNSSFIENVKKEGIKWKECKSG